MKNLVAAITAMMLVLGVQYMAQLSVPVLAPEIVGALGWSPALIGAYTSVIFITAIAVSPMCGGFIIRFGALRFSQAMLALSGLGLAVAALGRLPAFAATAVMIGSSVVVATAASSHILARYSPPDYAPLTFSIKQAGVPLGGLLAGVLMPFFVGLVGWRGALLATAVICAVVVVGLEPLRREFDRDRVPGHRLSVEDARRALRLCLATPALRELTLAGFVFAGMQNLFGSYFVTYLVTDLGRTLAAAGFVFALAQGAAMVTRILWGWVGSRFVPPRLVLAGLGVVMAAASAGVGLYAPAWPEWAVIAVAVVYGATAVGWHGVLFAEGRGRHHHRRRADLHRRRADDLPGRLRDFARRHRQLRPRMAHRRRQRARHRPPVPQAGPQSGRGGRRLGRGLINESRVGGPPFGRAWTGRSVTGVWTFRGPAPQ